MTRDEIIAVAREAGLYLDGENTQQPLWVLKIEELERFAAVVAAKEREVLEKELLKLKGGVAARADYIQGRWDLIGEFQDIIRARGTT
jgi:hypothetical protein